MFSHSHCSIENSSHHSRPTIGLLLVGVFPPNEELLWSGVMDAARHYDVNLISFCGSFVHHPDPLVAQANRLYQLVNPEVVDGLLIVSTVGWYFTDKELPAFFTCYHPLPCVSLDRAVSGVPSVVKNNYQGMYDAMVHIIEEHGYRRIAFLQGFIGAEWEQERYQAYRDSLNAHGLSFDPDLVVPLPTSWDSSGLPLGGEEQIRILLEERKLRPKVDIEAIVGATDALTRQALIALRTRKIAVPQEIAMIGFDDEETSRVMNPPLTTVRNPMYAIGRKGVEMLMAQLHGETVPERVSVPTPLIVRQSCGCRSSLVSRAVAGTAETGASLLKSSKLAIQRDKICAKLARTLDISSVQSLQNWPEIMWEAFIDELTGQNPGLFLSQMETLLNQAIEGGRSPIAWQDAISTLRSEVLPYLSPAERARAEDLWGQTRVLIAEVAQRVQAHQTIQAKHQAQVLREIGAKLITMFDVEQLMTILAEELPGLDITSCYLALYASDSDVETSQAVPPLCLDPAPEFSRLILAYNEHGRVALKPGGRRFRSRRLAPADLLPRDRRYSLVMEPLYFQEQQIGFALFETGPRQGSVYEALRVEISSALQGDLLVQRVQERTVEIARQKYVLDTFMETVPDSIYFKDRESRITRANQAHAEQLGLQNPDDEIGKTDFDFLPEHAARVIYEQEQTIMHSGQPIVSVEEIDPQGRWRLTTKMPLRDEHGDIVGTFGISRDITSLKHTEQELIQYREHLKIWSKNARRNSLAVTSA